MENINNGKLHAPEAEVRAGVYRHYKGNYYEVIGTALHSETLEQMIVYRALYGEHGLWVRPAHMWGELVDTPEGRVCRFAYVGQSIPGSEK